MPEGGGGGGGGFGFSDISSLIGQVGQMGGGGGMGSMMGDMGGAAGGAGGAGSWGRWLYIIKQIIGHLAAAGAAYADYRGAEIAEDTAGEQQRTNALLTTIDLILHGNRQQAYQQAVAATLDEIDAAYRSPEASRAIDQLRQQFGVAAAGAAAAQATAERGEQATLARHQATRRGMRGGSVEEAREAREAVGEAVTQGDVEGRRRQVERGVTRGMEAQRTKQRAEARRMPAPTTGSIMPYQSVLDAQGQLGAAKTEGIMGLKPIIRGVADAAATALSYGQRMKMDYDAASEAEEENRDYQGRIFTNVRKEPDADAADDGDFNPASVYDYLGAIGLK